MVLFDRSWYNRAAVERVMSFCTDEQYEEFFRSVPDFEKMLVRSGTGLQRDPTTHGAGRQQCRYRPARPELQTNRTTVDAVGLTRSVGYEGLRAAVHLDRPVQGGQPARTHRAENAKATTQTLPVVKGPACPCPPKNQDTWSRLGAKVSAIRLKSFLLGFWRRRFIPATRLVSMRLCANAQTSWSLALA